jgi:hypothetical protein
MKALVSDAADPQRTLRPFLHNAGLDGLSDRAAAALEAAFESAR